MEDMIWDNHVMICFNSSIKNLLAIEEELTDGNGSNGTILFLDNHFDTIDFESDDSYSSMIIEASLSHYEVERFFQLMEDITRRNQALCEIYMEDDKDRVDIHVFYYKGDKIFSDTVSYHYEKDYNPLTGVTTFCKMGGIDDWAFELNDFQNSLEHYKRELSRI